MLTLWRKLVKCLQTHSSHVAEDADNSETGRQVTNIESSVPI